MADTTATPYKLSDRLTEFSSAEGAIIVALAPLIHQLLPDSIWRALIMITMGFVGAAKIMYPNNATVQAVVTDVDTLVAALGQTTTVTTTTTPGTQVALPLPTTSTIVAVGAKP